MPFEQPSLFPLEPSPAAATRPVHTTEGCAAAPTVASDSLVRFGTSTWTYEGWQGLVYKKDYPKTRFKRECLAEYCHYQYKDRLLFTTVGLDQTFYRPPTPAQLERYALQVPAGFEFCSKVFERVTIPRYPNLPAEYGDKAGQVNADFLNVDLFLESVLAPYRAVFRAHSGPFIFEFQRSGLPEDFVARLDSFLAALPTDFRYAVEVRSPALLTADYLAVLAKHHVAHVYNHHTWMPPLMEQHERLGGTFSASFLVFRLLTPLRVKYEQAVRLTQPYNKIVAELPMMRQDTVRLVRQATAENRRSYVLVNNRSEGSAPLTCQALHDLLYEPSRHA